LDWSPPCQGGTAGFWLWEDGREVGDEIPFGEAERRSGSASGSLREPYVELDNRISEQFERFFVFSSGGERAPTAIGYIIEIGEHTDPTKPDETEIDLDRGLVAYYPFNGNANDESGNGNHGEVKGATLTEDRFGIADSSYELVADDVITVSNPFDGMQSFTKSLWFRVDNIGDHWGLLHSSACEMTHRTFLWVELRRRFSLPQKKRILVR